MAALNMMAKPVVAGLAVLAMALPVRAGGVFDFAFSFFGGGPHRPVAVESRVLVAPAPVRAVAPAPRVWVPPVYKTVVDRVWTPTVTTAYRDVPVVDAFGRVVSYRREAYNVQGGYWSEVTRQVLVREGYWAVARPSPVLHAGLALGW